MKQKINPENEMSRFITNPIRWFSSKPKEAQNELIEKHSPNSGRRIVTGPFISKIWEAETGFKSKETIESEHSKELLQLKEAYIKEKFDNQFH